MIYMKKKTVISAVASSLHLIKAECRVIAAFVQLTRLNVTQLDGAAVGV